MRLIEQDYLKLEVKNSSPYVEWFNKYLKEFNINTPNRLIAFFMNLFHESGNFKYVKELSDGSVYESRKNLGNTVKGDGKKYIGRGLGQITGRYNYNAFNKWCLVNIPDFKENFVSNPEKLEEPQWAVLSSFWYWKVNNLEQYADKRDFKNVASLWNTGKLDSTRINGLDDRIVKQIKIEKWITNLILAG